MSPQSRRPLLIDPGPDPDDYDEEEEEEEDEDEEEDDEDEENGEKWYVGGGWPMHRNVSWRLTSP
jgi:hypothetical protein